MYFQKTFTLDKLPAKLEGSSVKYFINNESDWTEANSFIGKKLMIEFTGKFQCLDCRKYVKKFYTQGLCYTCMMTSALNSDCILRPELCEAHLGRGKVPEWEETHHNQPHIVYFANSGDATKVGVTRNDQIPTRWIDQGADSAIILAQTPYRQLAGEIEVVLKNFLSDKTNWRAMLRNSNDRSIDLLSEKNKYADILYGIKQEYGEYISEDDTIYNLIYPSTIIDKSINSLKLDKQPLIDGILTGIKGQYLIFDEKQVFNMRSHGGYEIQLTVE
jgi:hypothetical protein